MREAKLTEIIRQKDPELRQAVTQLSLGNVEEAINGLRRQDRVHEISQREDRIRAIACTYVEKPESTLVISPDNDSRLEIAKRIHQEMQAVGEG